MSEFVIAVSHEVTNSGIKTAMNACRTSARIVIRPGRLNQRTRSARPASPGKLQFEMPFIYEDDGFGVRMTFPDSWTKRQVSPDCVEFLPGEVSGESLIPPAVMLRRAPFRSDQALDETIRDLMNARGVRRDEYEPADEDGWKGTFDPRDRTVTLVDLMKAVRVEWNLSA